MTNPTKQVEGDFVEHEPAKGRLTALDDIYSQLESMKPLQALKSLTKLSNDLLQRTAELPDSEQGLLAVLAEYRFAVFTFVSLSARI